MSNPSIFKFTLSCLVLLGALSQTGFATELAANTRYQNLKSERFSSNKRIQKRTKEKAAAVRIGVLPMAIGLSALSKPIFSLESDINLGKGFTVGPMFSYVPRYTAALSNDESASISAIGLRGNYYFNGKAISDSWIFGPYVNFIRPKITTLDSINGTTASFSGSTTILHIGAVIAYQWVWESGINLNLGAGAAYYQVPGSVTVNSSINGTNSSLTTDIPGFEDVGQILPAIEFTLGYAF